MNTQTFIVRLARRTNECRIHGDVVQCRVREGGVVERGSYMKAKLFACTFADGTTRTYWLRAGVPTTVKWEI